MKIITYTAINATNEKDNCGHGHKNIKDAERCLKKIMEYFPAGKYVINEYIDEIDDD